MTLQWTRLNNTTPGEPETLELSRPDEGIRLVAVLTAGPGRYLTPIRLFGLDSHPVDGGRVRRDLSVQATNLQRKLSGLDRLTLTDVRFGDEFAAARLGVLCDRPGLDPDVVKNVVLDSLVSLREVTERSVVAQLDYDLRRKHPTIGTDLDTIDFATKHTPSAIGTVTAFQVVLDVLGQVRSGHRVAVRGVGDLGSRIVGELRTGRCGQVVVHDLNPVRMAAVADGANVVALPDQNLDLAEVESHIFCADAGSLTAARAEKLAENPALIAVGGPEAGLDHSSEAIAKLVAAGKHFVPSVLCGAMGLVSNLLESMSAELDLGDQRLRLARLVEHMAIEAERTLEPFHEVCLAHLHGRNVG